MSKEGKKLLIAAVVLAVLLFGGGLLKKDKIQKEEASQTNKKLWSDDTQSITSIYFENNQGSQDIIKKTGENDPQQATYRDHEFQIAHDWYLKDSKDIYYVTSSMLDTFFESLEALNFSNIIEGGENRLKEYDLDKPIYKITLSGPGQNKRHFHFGSKTTDDQQRYAYDLENNRVGLVGLNLDFLDKRETQEWIEKSIAHINLDHINQIQIQDGPAIKKDNSQDWTIVHGDKKLPVNREKLQNWLRKINGLRASKIEKKSSTLEPWISFTMDSGQKTLSIAGHSKGDKAMAIFRSDDSYAYLINKDDVEGLLNLKNPEAFLNLNLLLTRDKIKHLKIQNQDTVDLAWETNQWSATEPFQGIADDGHIQSILDLLGGIKPQSFSRVTGAPKGWTFTLEDHQISKAYVVDAKAQQIHFLGEEPWSTTVNLPEDFEKDLKDHLKNLRKTDIYPNQLDDLSAVNIKSNNNNFKMTKDDVGEWQVEGSDSSELQYDVLSSIRELKIEAWEKKEDFQRQGDTEFSLTSSQGVTYTWHIGQVKDKQQMILNTLSAQKVWVNKSKLDTLINQL